jgi:hypothetical protein
MHGTTRYLVDDQLVGTYFRELIISADICISEAQLAVLRILWG